MRYLMCYLRQIDRDCELLEQEGIMDYSLLVGIHFKDISPEGELIPSGSHTPTGTFLTLKLLAHVSPLFSIKVCLKCIFSLPKFINRAI